MSENVADFILSRLKEWGIERIYGFPGDGINGLVGAIHSHHQPKAARAPGLHTGP